MQTSTEQSASSGITLRSDIDPIKVSYDEDPELDWPVSKGDTTVLESLFDPQLDNAAVSSSSVGDLQIVFFLPPRAFRISTSADARIRLYHQTC